MPPRPLELFVEARVEVPPVEGAAQGIDGRRVRVVLGLHERTFAAERERRRRHHRPQRRHIVSRKGPAVPPIGHAHDTERLVRGSHRHGDERLGRIARPATMACGHRVATGHVEGAARLEHGAHHAHAGIDAQVLHELERIAEGRHNLQMAL